MRDEVDAILVGSGTVRADDPRLTTRLPDGAGRDPIRIILEGRRALPRDAQVFRLKSSAPTWLATGRRDAAASPEVIVAPAPDGRVDLVQLMDELGRREVSSLLIEGGAEVLASAFAAHIVDKVMFFVAPIIIGGDGLSAIAPMTLDTLNKAVQLRELRCTALFRDLLIEGYVQPRISDAAGATKQ